MIRAFQEIKAELKNRRKNVSALRDDEGRAVVDFRVNNDDEFLSPYSVGNHDVIAQDVAEFIEGRLSTLPVEEHVRLRIHSDVISKREEKIYEQAIRDYYADKYESVRQEKRRLSVMALVMAIIGVLALTVMIALEVFALRTSVILEVIDIFAWVFLWESVDLFFFECTALRIKQKRYLSVIESVVEYLPLTKKEK